MMLVFMREDQVYMKCVPGLFCPSPAPDVVTVGFPNSPVRGGTDEVLSEDHMQTLGKKIDPTYGWNKKLIF